MIIRRLTITFLIVLAGTVSICAQAVQFNQGKLDRNGGDLLGSVNGTFRFQNANSDITGKLSGIPSSGIYTLCDFYGTPCAPGQLIRIRDQITGSSGLRQDTAPIVINGVTHPVVFYFGQLTFDGGTVRIPYTVAKRRTFKLTVRGKVTGGITGFPHPASTEPIFGANLNLTGTVTLEFRRKENGSPAPTYDLVSVIYDFP
jgi:hypothetical protein